MSTQSISNIEVICTRRHSTQSKSIITTSIVELEAVYLQRASTFNYKMTFLHLFIVNKSGGLIHHRALSPKAPQIGTNEWLRIGSTFHSLYAIANEASPMKLPQNKTLTSGADDGIEEIQADGLVLRCLQTRTGIKFVVT